MQKNFPTTSIKKKLSVPLFTTNTTRSVFHVVLSGTASTKFSATFHHSKASRSTNTKRPTEHVLRNIHFDSDRLTGGAFLCRTTHQPKHTNSRSPIKMTNGAKIHSIAIKYRFNAHFGFNFQQENASPFFNAPLIEWWDIYPLWCIISDSTCSIPLTHRAKP